MNESKNISKHDEKNYSNSIINGKLTLLSANSFDTTKKGVITGIANKVNILDDLGYVMQLGAYDKTVAENPKVYAFWQHNPNRAIGTSHLSIADDGSLMVRMELNLDTTEGRDAYYNTKKYLSEGMNMSFSIGFYVKDKELGKFNGKEVQFIKEIKVGEVSLVYEPGNKEAQIHEINSSKISIQNKNKENVKMNNLKKEKLSEQEIEKKEELNVTKTADEFENENKDKEVIKKLKAELKKADNGSKKELNEKIELEVNKQIKKLEDKKKELSKINMEKFESNPTKKQKLDENKIEFLKLQTSMVQKINGFKRKANPELLAAITSTTVNTTNIVIKPGFDNDILGKIKDSSKIYGLLNPRPITSGSHDFLIEDADASVGATAEGVAYNESNEPTVVKVNVVSNKLTLQKSFTEEQQLWTPSFFQTYLTNKFKEAFELAIESQLLNGTGANNTSKGILKYNYSQKVTTASKGSITDVELNKLLNSLKLNAKRNAVLIMSPLTWDTIKSLKDTTGAFLYDHNRSLEKGDILKFRGHTVILSELMPELSDGGKISIWFGDLSNDNYFGVVQSWALNFQTDPYTGMANGITKIFGSMSFGFKILQEKGFAVVINKA